MLKGNRAFWPRFVPWTAVGFEVPKVENVGERLLTKKDGNGDEELLGRLIVCKWHPAAINFDYQGLYGTNMLAAFYV